MDKYILVQYLTSLNSVITETFKSTQRIKLTSFDISENYIVFGASSGGIYIFKREPCEFLKLIPSKDGSATQIVIAPNEKNMAIASSKGLIVILESFLDADVSPFVHNEHEGNCITAMKWHGNDIYIGDNIGKISVFSLSNLLTIFQTPSAVLMNLDSCIVQVDIYLNYLLISTQTRTYLCDTEKEQYKQIGKKTRDGNFGACFSNVSNTDIPETSQSSRGIFKTIKEDENFATCLSNADIKIYCARPGARLWEANFKATVLVTHQFRESLTQSPSDLLCVSDEIDATLNVIMYKDLNSVSKNFNFGIIYPICGRFILTYDSEAIYFFDPETGSLIFWNNSFNHIKYIKILNSVVYIWQANSKINIIALELLENLIIKTLFKKQYYLCAELCIYYPEEVLNLVHKFKRIHLISILKTKLNEIRAPELLEKIKPILQFLEDHKRSQNARKKLRNGIELVEISPVNHDLEENNCLPESVQNLNMLNNGIKTMKIKNKETTVKEYEVNNIQNANADSNRVENSQENQQLDKRNMKLVPLYKQYQLNKTHKNVELTESSILLNALNLDDTLLAFEDFIQYVENSDNDNATQWCKEQFIKQASRKCFDLKEINQNTLFFLTEAFLELNKSDNLSCKCKFPLPKAHKEPLKYYKLGCAILDQSENVNIYLDNIPYLHKYKLSKINNLNDVFLNLPLITQFSDTDLFQQFIALLTYDTWDELIKLFINLKQGICLNCGEIIDIDGSWSWKNIGLLMIKSIGPLNTSRLLKRYSQNIPNGELDFKFYQCCILATTLDHPSFAVNFLDKTVNEHTSPQFEALMEKFLQRKYLGCQSVPIKSSAEVPKCVYCELPLDGPILNDLKKCQSGHNFHSLCFSHNNNICIVCTSTT